MWIRGKLVPWCVHVNKRLNKRDRCHDAMYSRIRCKSRLHWVELTLIPFLFFVVGVRVETATAFYFKT